MDYLPYSFSHILSGLNFKSEPWICMREGLRRFFLNSSRRSHCVFEEHQVDRIQQSYNPYAAAGIKEHIQKRVANAITNSKSDDPDSYNWLDPKTELGKMIIVEKWAAIKQRARKLRVKMAAEKRFLCDKSSKRVSKIIQQCPDIGKVIETYVQN